jgi:hypothetical protein
VLVLFHSIVEIDHTQQGNSKVVHLKVAHLKSPTYILSNHIRPPKSRPLKVAHTFPACCSFIIWICPPPHPPPPPGSGKLELWSWFVISFVLFCDLSCLVLWSLLSCGLSCLLSCGLSCSCLVVSLILFVIYLVLSCDLSCLVVSLVSCLVVCLVKRVCSLLSCLMISCVALSCRVVSYLPLAVLVFFEFDLIPPPPPYPDKLELSCYDLSCFVISLLLSWALTLKLCQPPPIYSTTNTAIVLSHTYASVNWLCRSIYSTESC